MSANGRLSGKVGVVTGAGQGAGAGCAQALADDGCSVLLVGRTAAKLDDVAAGIADSGGTAATFTGDITTRECVDGIIATALERFGRIDGLVNAAQSPQMRAAALLDTDDDMAAELWASGPVATLMLMRACHPHMSAVGGGSIVNFATGALRRPAAYGVYAACKAAIETIGRAASAEWGPAGIRVNTIVPLVMSPSLELDMSIEQQDATIARLPLRRIGRPLEDIGRAVAFLISEDAAYVTGNTLLLEGGGWSSR